MSKIITQEEFVSKVKAIHGDDYKILSEYKGIKEEVMVEHKCGKTYPILPSSLYKSKGCKYCCDSVKEGRKKAAKSSSNGLEKFKQQVFDLVGNEYTVIGTEYINNKTPIMVRHNTCGHEYPVRPNDFTSRGRRCPECAKAKRQSGNKKKIKDNYLQDLLIDEPEYQWTEEYKGSNKELHMIKHLTCGHEYPVRPNDFQQGYRCPICNTRNESKSTKYIKKYLKEKNVEFDTEVKFTKCKNQRSLPFDIRVKDFIIEYDGQQHFMFNNYELFNEEKYKKTKENDSIKNKFMMKQSKYRFIRLHYKLKNEEIKEILQSILSDEFDMSLIFKYNLFYSDGNSIINRKTYYTNMNREYFNEEV